jgi:hypothetical protein
MNERDVEMREHNDPLEHAASEVDAGVRDDMNGADVGAAVIPSPTNPEVRRDQAPDTF